jgi:hypothetical protein
MNPGTLACLAITAILGPATCHAALYSLQDSQSTRPNLATGEQNAAPTPLTWWEGGPAFALASAGAVRINFRGVILYPPTARVRNFSSSGSGWHSTPCNVSAWALCSSDVGLVFPYTPPRMPERRAAVQVDGWADLACSNSGGKVLTQLGVYDISACDIFDEGLDVLYSDSRIAHRHASTPVWKYWTMVVLAIILVRNLSYNVQDLWEKSPGGVTTKEQWPALLSSLALLTLVLIDGDSAFVTSADQLFFWTTAGYVLIYLAVHAWNRWGPGGRPWKKRNGSEKRRSEQEQQDEEEQEEENLLILLDPDAAQERRNEIILMHEEEREQQQQEEERARNSYEKPVYNILVATLQLVAMHFYSSAETPYNIVLLGMLACRGW